MSAQFSIAHYQITAKLGEGGMGEVWRATDTKLGREVAIKILPEHFAADPDRLARFTREAHVLASLNHPNIAAIFGVEDRALVLELVEGPTLGERIALGAIPSDEALPMILQLIDGLEYAHEKGIVHRDLKPANIKLSTDGRLKVLDFGLARVFTSDTGAGPASSSTLTVDATTPGKIVGTAAYMAPEQARGHTVDRRADVWAFGVIVYEMLTGRKLFAAGTVNETLAAVLRQDVDFTLVPARFATLLRLCLARDVGQRLRHIGDARFFIDEAPLAIAPAAPSRLKAYRWLAAALAIAAVVPAAVLWRVTRPVVRQVVELNVDLGENATLGQLGSVAVSRDGSRIAFIARLDTGRQGLAVKALSQSQPTLLAGTENGSFPFFSPDGQWLGFFAEGKLRKVAVQGGSPVILCDAPSGRGSSWGDDGYIYAALNNSTGIARIPENGGTPAAVTTLRADERSHRSPQAVPGSRIVLFTSNRTVTDWDQANVEAISLKTNQRTVLVRGGYCGRYLPSGHLVYMHGGSLLAARLDLNPLRLGGTRTPVIPELAALSSTGGGQFDFSDSGLLVYAAARPETSRYSFGWLRQGGKLERIGVPEDFYAVPRLSPDGNRVAFVNTRTEDIWTYEFRRGSFVRLTSTGEGNWYPVWTPDGNHLVFSSNIKEGHAIWWVRADASSPPVQLLERQEYINPFSFSSDGRTLAYMRFPGIELARLDLGDPDHPKVTGAETWLSEGTLPVFSPDSRWIAYVSQESGRPEVYVRPVPAGHAVSTAKWAVSTGGGGVALWSRDGRRLFYSTPDNFVMVVDYVVNGGTFQPGIPRRWSDSPIRNAESPNFDVAPDGKRIITFPAAEPAETQGNLHLTFVFNFFDELKRRIP